MPESHKEYNERSKSGDRASHTEGFKKENDDDKKLSPGLGTGSYQSGAQRSDTERLKKEEGDRKKWSTELETGSDQSGNRRSSKLDITNLLISDYEGSKEEDDDDRERLLEVGTESYPSVEHWLEGFKKKEGKRQSPQLVTGAYQSGDQRRSKLDITNLLISDYEGFKEEDDDDRERLPEAGTESYPSVERWLGGFKKKEDSDKRQWAEPGTGLYQSDNRATHVESFKKEEGYEGDSDEETAEKNSEIMADSGRRLVRKLRIRDSSDDRADDDPENFNDISTNREDLKQDICGSNPQEIPENKKRDLKMKSPMVYDETSDDDFGTLRTYFQELVQKGKEFSMSKSGEGSSKNVEENYEFSEKSNSKAVQLGVRISHLLVKMVLLLSDSLKKLPKFKESKHSVKFSNKKDFSVVITKFIIILEMMIIIVGKFSELTIETNYDKLLSRILTNITCLKSIVEQSSGVSEYLLDLKMIRCEVEIEETEQEVSKSMMLCSGSLWVLDMIQMWGKEINDQIDQA